MRIVNQKFTVRSIVFSKVSGILYFLIFAFFVYKCLTLLPIWLSSMDKANEARIDYEKKQEYALQKQEAEIDKQTNLGKERYQKDFFNKLDEGEHLIILYHEEKDKQEVVEEERKMFWWEEMHQNFLVWWKNLDIWKK